MRKKSGGGGVGEPRRRVVTHYIDTINTRNIITTVAAADLEEGGGRGKEPDKD